MRKCYVCKKEHKTNHRICRDCQRTAAVRSRSCSRQGDATFGDRTAKMLTSVLLGK